MKQIACCFFIFFLCLNLHGCSGDPDKKILAKINNYNLSLDEFQYQLAAELELYEDFKLTEEAKEEFLEGLVQKVILLQEAKKQKLDTQEKFIRAIERYWESTLIRDLIDLKSREISEKVYISQEEIENRYNEIKAADNTLPPLVDMQEELSSKMKEQKKSRMLETWIGDLRKNTSVEIDKDLL